MKEQLEINEIKIMPLFQSHRPSERKLDACRKHFTQYRIPDRELVITKDGYLIDGYVQYLIYKEFNYLFVNVIRLKDFFDYNNWQTQKARYLKYHML